MADKSPVQMITAVTAMPHLAPFCSTRVRSGFSLYPVMLKPRKSRLLHRQFPTREVCWVVGASPIPLLSRPAFIGERSAVRLGRYRGLQEFTRMNDLSRTDLFTGPTTQVTLARVRIGGRGAPTK